MTTTCLINNYNYARYVVEAVESALGQTLAFDQIVVVDDGSTDGSVELLRARFADAPSVEIVAKENGGQLSSFNAGFALASGDLVFLLDADDAYEPHYLATAVAQYQAYPEVDFLCCGRRYVGDRSGELLPHARDRDLGYSVIRTVHQHAWLGGPTSCLSMRRSLLARMLPLPLEEDWRTRADDCLVFGASLVGGRKRHLAQALVRYRVHAANNFCGKRPHAAAAYARRLAVNRLFGHLIERREYEVSQLADFAHREFCTIPQPTFRELKSYLRLTLGARLPLARKLPCAGTVLQHYLGSLSWHRWQERHRGGTPPAQSNRAAHDPPAAFDQRQSAA